MGHIVATPGALAALEQSGERPDEFLSRHASGDWADLCEGAIRENEFSLEQGFRLVSSHSLPNGTVIWVVTEADRSSTTILLPSEY
jgi:hypothetical protein